MSKHRHDHASGHRPAAVGRKPRGPMALLGLLLGVIACIAVFVWTPEPNRRPAPVPASKSEGPTSTNEPARAVAPTADRGARLVGRWLRTDGDYALIIKHVSADGKLEAAYENPQPIRVSRAESSVDGDRVRVFVELRDTGYPGCTYKLDYRPEADRLEGVYFQAALRESFEVAFVRAK